MPFDAGAFAHDLAALRAELEENLGAEDLAHFEKMARWGRTCTALGYATGWIAPNPLSAALLAVGSTARWTIVTHHVSHRGIDKLEPARREPRSKTYAKGWRRLVDWLDWMTPEAWAYEHNVLHHYRTGETADPDLVELNMKRIRESELPRAVKWGVIGFYACTWKLSYYAPNNWQVLRRGEHEKRARRGEKVEPVPADATLFSEMDPRTANGRAFLASLLPYALARFVAAPAAFLPLGPWASASVLLNSLGAEVLTNLHTFAIIVPNHAGSDLWRFDEPLHDKHEFFVRQTIGSANCKGGNDVADFLLGYLNYQIEHHLWPDLPPLKYRQAQPRVQAICEKHGVPYANESVFARVKRMLAIMIGDGSMHRTRDARGFDADADVRADTASLDERKPEPSRAPAGSPSVAPAE
jgi:fatty acid desaturase